MLLNFNGVVDLYLYDSIKKVGRAFPHTKYLRVRADVNNKPSSWGLGKRPGGVRPHDKK